MNTDLYPNDYPDIEGLTVGKQIDSLNIDLILSFLKSTGTWRSTGYMNAKNQIREERLSQDGVGVIGNSPVGQLDIFQEIDAVVGGEILVIAVSPSFKEAKEDASAFESGATIMPITYVGKTAESTIFNQIPNFPVLNIDFKGRGGYYLGGFTENQNLTTAMQKIDFVGETLTLSDRTLSEFKSHFCVTGERTGFWTLGGWAEDIYSTTDSIERTNYIDESTYLLSNKLSQPRTMTSGVSTPSKSFLLGGVYGVPNPKIGFPFSRNIECLTHLDLSSVSLGNLMISARGNGSSSSIKGNKTSAYLWGDVGVAWQALSNIHKFNFIDTSYEILGIVLSSGQSYSASLGNEQYIYLLGGESPTPSPKWGDGLSTITRLDMESHTINSLGISLNGGRSHCGATGSNRFGYILGGWGAEGTASGGDRLPAQSIEKINFNNGAEYIGALGIQSIYPNATMGSISDYGETFYL